MRNTRPISKTRSIPPATSRFSGSSERDPQIGVEIESVVVRDERARGRPTLLQVEDRRLDLDEGLLLQTTANRLDRGVTHRKDPSGIVVDDEVDVALPIPGVDVGKALPFVGQRSQRLRQELEVLELHGQLALLRRHHRTDDTDPVTAIQVVERGERFVADGALRHEQLDVTGRVAKVSESEAALLALEQETTGYLYPGLGLGARFEMTELVTDLAQRVITVESVGVRVLSCFTESGDLGEAQGADVARRLGGFVATDSSPGWSGWSGMKVLVGPRERTA